MNLLKEAVHLVKETAFSLTHNPFLHRWIPAPNGAQCWIVDIRTDVSFEARLIKVSTIGVKIAIEKLLHEAQVYEVKFIDPATPGTISLRARIAGMSVTPSSFRPFRLLFPFTHKDYADLMNGKETEVEYTAVFPQGFKIPREYAQAFYRFQRKR